MHHLSPLVLQGRRSVENMDEISSAIQERYPAVQVRLIDFSSEESYAGRSWGVPRTDGTKMSWREQVGGRVVCGAGSGWVEWVDCSAEGGPNCAG